MKKPIVIINVLAVMIIIGYIAYNQLTGDKSNSNTNSVAIELNSNQNTNASETEHKYIHDDFIIIPPAEWIQSQTPGTLATFYNMDEQHPNDSAAAKINFKSYTAVSFDTLVGQTLDEVNTKIIQDIQSSIPSVESVSVSDETINGLPARFNVLTMTQQEVDYQVLVVVVLDEVHDRYYIISGNTTAKKWNQYEAEFMQTARSLVIK